MILFACDPERTIIKKTKEGFLACVKFLRSIVNERAKQDPRIQLLNPDFTLPFLLFIIAHSFDFENDAPDYALCGKYLLFFIDHIKTTNNLVFIYKSFDYMRKTKDAIAPEFSERTYVLCEIGKSIIQSKSPKKWIETNSGVFVPAIYQKITDVEELQKLVSHMFFFFFCF